MTTVSQRFPAVLALASLSCGLGCSQDEAATPTFENLLVVMVDTLRSDHLPSYGYPRDTAPYLSRLAGEGIQLQGYSASSWTRPSIATLLSGLHPQRHQTISRADALGIDVPYLPAILAEHGFKTAAMMGNPNVGRKWGFDRGVGGYLQSRGVTALDGDAQVVTDKVLALATELEPPFYLQVLYIDPHDPYIPEEPWRDGDDASEPWEYVQPQRLARARAELDELTLDRLVRQYDGEVRDFDRHFERLMGELGALGLLDGTLVVVTADHGEELGEHGRLTHSKTLYEEVVRVPLILWSREGLPSFRGDALFHQVDFVPTVLEALGLEVPAGLDGESQWRLLSAGRPPGERDLFFHLDLGERAALAVRRGSRKLVHSHRRPYVEVSDLVADPGELRPSAELSPEDRRLFRRLIEHHNELVTAGGVREVRTTEGELRRSLAALGYLDVDTPEEALRERFIPGRLDPERGLLPLVRQRRAEEDPGG